MIITRCRLQRTCPASRVPARQHGLGVVPGSEISGIAALLVDAPTTSPFAARPKVGPFDPWAIGGTVRNSWGRGVTRREITFTRRRASEKFRRNGLSVRCSSVTRTRHRGARPGDRLGSAWQERARASRTTGCHGARCHQRGRDERAPRPHRASAARRRRLEGLDRSGEPPGPGRDGRAARSASRTVTRGGGIILPAPVRQQGSHGR